MSAVSPLPFLPRRRRSHLDSACYRTLVRIFSHCLDEPLATCHRAIPNPNPTSDAPPPETPSSDKEPIFDRNANGNIAVADEIVRPEEEEESPSLQELSRDKAADESETPSSDKEPIFDRNASGIIAVADEIVRPDEEESPGLQELSCDKAADESVSERLRSGDAGAEASSGDLLHDANGGCQAVEGDGNRHLSSGGHSGGTDSEMLGSLDLGCSGLIDDAEDEMFDEVKKLLDVDTDELQIKDQFTDFSRSPKISVDENCMSGVSHVEMIKSLEELLSGGELTVEELLECGSGGGAKGGSLGRITSDEAQVTQTETLKEDTDSMQQQALVCLDARTSSFRSGKLDKDQVISPEGLGNIGEIEEGEISDEVQLVNNQEVEEELACDDFADEGNSAGINCVYALNASKEDNRGEDESDARIHQKKVWNSDATHDDRCAAPEMKLTNSNRAKANSESQAVTTNALGEASEDVGVREKRKRAPLTEKRRAAKKTSKKRKRAEKDRLEGVKRLKLQPILKPKVVKECKHYMKGRCNQGALCKFSHDATPLTKSQPCTYFARNICLKGEDCAFDHDLSKYPCHKMSNGMCSRGDECKFSHKILVPEDCSKSISSKSGSLLSSGKQLKGNASLVASNPPKSTTTGTLLPMSKNMEANTAACPKEPVRVPNGVRFLTFGKEPVECAIKQHNLISQKHGGTKLFNQENQEKVSAGGHKHAPNAGRVDRRPAINSPTSKGSRNISSVAGAVVAPFSSSIQPEVSDASKILDEFLFGGG